jgi:hypothetical protein
MWNREVVERIDAAEKRVVEGLAEIGQDYKDIDRRWLQIQGAIGSMTAHDEVYRQTMEKFLSRLAVAQEQTAATLAELNTTLKRMDGRVYLVEGRTHTIEEAVVAMAASARAIPPAGEAKPARARKRVPA